LLNEAREKTEKIIDTLHEPLIGIEKKVRTYRQQARKNFLSFTKKRKPLKKTIRKTVRKKLGYVEHNLYHIKKLAQEVGSDALSRKQYRDLLVIGELHRQQKEMYEESAHSIQGRIVSIHQPHVRPMVRGKASAMTEFGAKSTISVVDGYVFTERLSWEAYNEANDLIEQIERYKDRFGYYPESVHVDQIYRNRENRAYCKSHGIRLSGPMLGRPPKDRKQNREIIQQTRQDERDRIPVEGKFGNGKRRYGLGRIMAKRADTSESAIGTIILVLNLEKVLRDLFWDIFRGIVGLLRCTKSPGSDVLRHRNRAA
jgi:transposase, IS5 family